MKNHALALGLAAVLVTAAACSKSGDNGNAAGNEPAAQTPAAQKAAGTKTIAAGLPADSQFMVAAKAAGLDQTLAGPGPYTVLVPDDAAFAKAPEGTFAATPGNRGQITSILTNLILPGTVLSADISKAIDNGKGKAVLATMGGGTLTATKDGDTIVLTDSKGNKAHVTQADQQYSNGVVQHIDALLMPAKQTPAPTKAGK